MSEVVPGVNSTLSPSHNPSIAGVLTVKICHTIPTGQYQTMKPEIAFSCDVPSLDALDRVHKSVVRKLRSLYAALLLQEAAAADEIRSEGVESYARNLLALTQVDG